VELVSLAQVDARELLVVQVDVQVLLVVQGDVQVLLVVPDALVAHRDLALGVHEVVQKGAMFRRDGDQDPFGYRCSSKHWGHGCLSKVEVHALRVRILEVAVLRGPNGYPSSNVDLSSPDLLQKQWEYR